MIRRQPRSTLFPTRRSSDLVLSAKDEGHAKAGTIFAGFLKILPVFILVLPGRIRSEEHTSELQSLRHLVCRLLLEKKKDAKKTNAGTRAKMCRKAALVICLT